MARTLDNWDKKITYFWRM